MSDPHKHVWVDCEVHCEDCGSHSAVRCDTREECPDGFGWEPVDLVFNDDPRGAR